MSNARGEIFFDLTKDTHPLYGRSKFLLKRWKQYSIYANSGSYSRTDNPRTHLYSTSSVYLYDYVVVSADWFNSIVYSSSFVDDTPAAISDQVGSSSWTHRESTFSGSPNAITNNYLYTFNVLSSSISPFWASYGPPLIFTDSGEYFEIVGGYPRNHQTHKRHLFSLYKLTTYGKENGQITSGSYRRCQQTSATTIGQSGLEDGSSPIQTTQVSNLNLIQSDNVINQ